MNAEYIKENYYFETLTKQHDLNQFKSPNDDLNEYLINDTLEQQENKFNVTKLVICDDEIIGYFSLLTDTLVLNKIRDNKLKLDIKQQLNITDKKKLLPAVKIGRLAISEKYTNQGLGSHILRNILLDMEDLSNEKIGVRFVIVESYPEAYNFYVKHNNFVNLKKDDVEVKKLNKIIEKDPNRRFYLYYDIMQ